jgi:hypothetical protein
MKIRTGFVSNSSSSSFTCDISGTSLSGWDGEYDEGVCEMECGHSFLEEYLLPEEDKERSVKEKKDILLQININDKVKTKLIDKANDDVINELFEEIDVDDLDEDSYSSLRCPICQFKVISQEDFVSYLITKVGGTEKSIKKNILKEFENYKEFQKYIK